MTNLLNVGNWRTARRAGADGAINLGQRRAWFADDAPGAQNDDGGQDSPGQGEPTDVNALPSWAQSLIKELRKEAGDRRAAAKAAFDKAAEEERQRLENEKRWEELAGKYRGEVEQLKPRAERLDSLENFLRESVTQRIEALPQQFRGLVPQYDDPLKTLQWLDANASVLTTPRAPGTDAGAGGSGGGTKLPRLTPEQEAVARAMNLTPEQYAKRLAEIAAQRANNG